MDEDPASDGREGRFGLRNNTARYSPVPLGSQAGDLSREREGVAFGPSASEEPGRVLSVGAANGEHSLVNSDRRHGSGALGEPDEVIPMCRSSLRPSDCNGGDGGDEGDGEQPPHDEPPL